MVKKDRDLNYIINLIINNEAISVTHFVHEKYRIRATRKLFGSKINKKDRSVDIVLTLGSPNYAERELIKRAKREDKHPFPITRIWK